MADPEISESGYDSVMPSFSVCRLSFLSPILFGSLLAQDATSFATLDIDFGAPTNEVWGRYVWTDGKIAQTGWIHPHNGEKAFVITRLLANRQSNARGIIYSPGCALETFDIAVRELRRYVYSFHCAPSSEIEIHGQIPYSGRLYDGDSTIEAKYVADWAPDFFQYNDGTATEIPLAGAGTLDDQTHFHIPIPNFITNKFARSPIHDGEIRIYIRNRKSGQIVDQWRFTSPDSKLRSTRFGGIPIDLIQPDSGLLTFCPTRSVLAHDQFGFAVRPDTNSVCLP